MYRSQEKETTLLRDATGWFPYILRIPDRDEVRDHNLQHHAHRYRKSTQATGIQEQSTLLPVICTVAFSFAGTKVLHFFGLCKYILKFHTFS